MPFWPRALQLVLPPDRTSKVANLFLSKVQIAEYANCNFTSHDQLEQAQIRFYIMFRRGTLIDGREWFEKNFSLNLGPFNEF